MCPARRAIVHGWRDDIVPVESSIRWAREHHAALHVLNSDHRLEDRIEAICALLRGFLAELGLLREREPPRGARSGLLSAGKAPDGGARAPGARWAAMRVRPAAAPPARRVPRLSAGLRPRLRLRELAQALAELLAGAFAHGIVARAHGGVVRDHVSGIPPATRETRADASDPSRINRDTSRRESAAWARACLARVLRGWPRPISARARRRSSGRAPSRWPCRARRPDPCSGRSARSIRWSASRAPACRSSARASASSGADNLAAHHLVDIGLAHGRGGDIVGHHAPAEIALQEGFDLGDASLRRDPARARASAGASNTSMRKPRTAAASTAVSCSLGQVRGGRRARTCRGSAWASSPGRRAPDLAHGGLLIDLRGGVDVDRRHRRRGRCPQNIEQQCKTQSCADSE